MIKKNQNEKLLQIRNLNCDSSGIFEMPKDETSAPKIWQSKN